VLRETFIKYNCEPVRSGRMNYLTTIVHEVPGKKVPRLEFCLISPYVRHVYTWEFDITKEPKLVIPNNYKTLYLKGIHNSFTDNVLVDKDIESLPPLLREINPHKKFIPISELKFPKIRHQEVVPLLIRRGARDFGKCSRCRRKKRPRESCAESIARSMEKVMRTHFPCTIGISCLPNETERLLFEDKCDSQLGFKSPAPVNTLSTK
jgi:hypothetical protein